MNILFIKHFCVGFMVSESVRIRLLSPTQMLCLLTCLSMLTVMVATTIIVCFTSELYYLSLCLKKHY